MKFKRLTTKLWLVAILTMFIPICSNATPPLEEEDDILDMILPVLLAPKEVTGTLSIPINFPKKKKTYVINKTLGIKATVYVKESGDFAVPPPKGYKFCAYRNRTSSASPKKSKAEISRDLPNKNMAHVYFDVPCGGGGVSIGTFNDILATAIVSAAAYFTAGTATGLTAVASDASYWKFLSAGAYTRSSVFAAIVSGLVGKNYLSEEIAKQMNPRYNEGACGIGDAGNWLITNLDILYTRKDDSCNVSLPQSWTRF